MITIQKSIHSGYGSSTTAKEVIENIDLQGKVIIVTGGYSGVGLETAKVFAQAGAEVIVPARNVENAKKAVGNLPNIQIEDLDLMNPSSIDQFAERFLATHNKLDILVNSAGIMASPLMRDERGNEAQFSTNHLGHFQLTARLWPALKNANSARIVAVSSRAHRLGGINFEDPNFETTEYDKWTAYAQSKTANILFAVELDRLANTYGVRAFSVHPGLIPSTNIGRFNEEEKATPRQIEVKGNRADSQEPAAKFKTIEQGAATTVWCATSDALDGKGGVYCEDCDISEAVPSHSLKENGVRPWAIDPGSAKRLWKLSEKLTGVEFEF
jgi:NAD(P)-dependent dehydrogenase (short-subunit alcohol dehydrogenase family)